MEGILKSDIFFFITSVIVVFLGVAGLFVLLQIHRLLKEVREIARTTRQAADWMLEDLDEMREAVHEKGLRLRFIMNFFRGLFAAGNTVRHAVRRRKGSKDEEIDDDDDGLED